MPEASVLPVGQKTSAVSLPFEDGASVRNLSTCAHMQVGDQCRAVTETRRPTDQPAFDSRPAAPIPKSRNNEEVNVTDILQWLAPLSLD